MEKPWALRSDNTSGSDFQGLPLGIWMSSSHFFNVSESLFNPHKKPFEVDMNIMATVDGKGRFKESKQSTQGHRASK